MRRGPVPTADQMGWALRRLRDGRAPNHEWSCPQAFEQSDEWCCDCGLDVAFAIQEAAGGEGDHAE